MRLLQDQLEQLRVHMSAVHLFPRPPMIHFTPAQQCCSFCSRELLVQKTRLKRRAATLAIGEFRVHETVLCCPGCATVVHTQQLREMIPSGAAFGYDVIVHIGKMLFLRCRGYREIQEDLRSRNIFISTSEIGVLTKKFVLLMGKLHRSMQGQLNGGYILHLNGTCDGASPHLISALDGITEIVLENIKLTSENAEDLIPFLKHIRSCYGDPIAVVSDMGKGVTGAIRTVFAHIPAFICHFHVLKAAGNDLLGKEQEVLRSRFRKHAVRRTLRNLKKRLEQHMSARDPQSITALAQGLSDHVLCQQDSYHHLPLAAAYMLVSWVLDASSTCDGFGFPFDQAYLVLYQRIQEAYCTTKELLAIQLRGTWKDNRCYGWILADLRAVVTDITLSTAAARMEEKAEVFSRLRQAMRITLPGGNRGLTDEGELSVNMRTIRKEVTTFCTRLLKEDPPHPEYRKLAEKIQVYGDQLFSDPIPVHTAAGTILIQPQRTNNLLETFFRKLMRGYRKRNGFSAAEKILKAMLPDIPLAMNLKNEQYMNLLLGEGFTLEQRFAEIDTPEIRRLLKENPLNSCAAYPQIKNIIRLPDLPKSIAALLKKTAS